MAVRRPFLLFALLASVVAAVASGCGGASQSAPPTAELTSFASVAKASTASTSARFLLSVSQSVPGTDQVLAFEASGAFDSEAERAQIDLDLSSLADLVGGFGAAFGGGTGDLSTDPDDWKLGAIVDGDVVYITFPLISDQLPAGKTWIKGNAKQLAGQAGGGLDQFGSFAQTDPRDVFEYLAVSGGIETVGAEELRGVATTHYRATIDVAKALDLVPAEQRNGIADLDRLLGQTGLTEIPVDVWLDADQRVHKFELSLELTAPGSDRKARTAMTIEVWDYGVPLELELPAADQVVDASTLQKP